MTQPPAPRRQRKDDLSGLFFCDQPSGAGFFYNRGKMYDLGQFIDYYNMKPDVYKERFSIAAKEHQCGECNSRIKKGETYHVFYARENGQTIYRKTCVNCFNRINSERASERA